VKNPLKRWDVFATLVFFFLTIPAERYEIFSRVEDKTISFKHISRATYDLDEHIKVDQLLPLSQVLRIRIECAEALDYARQQKVVHRDIKPSNIMYGPETGSVKITDFGIARITDSSKTRTGTVLGTPNYMSPEQCMGKKVDGRADLFSLGVLL
jgi:serine/threonine protein kinase